MYAPWACAACNATRRNVASPANTITFQISIDPIVIIYTCHTTPIIIISFLSSRIILIIINIRHFPLYLYKILVRGLIMVTRVHYNGQTLQSSHNHSLMKLSHKLFENYIHIETQTLNHEP